MAGEHRGNCPICTAPWEERFKPFCSRRCADVDLSRWLRGGYTIPIVNDDEDDDGDPGNSSGGDAGNGSPEPR